MGRKAEALEALRRKALDPGSTEEERRSSALEALRWADRYGFVFVREEKEDGPAEAAPPAKAQQAADAIRAAAGVANFVNTLFDHLDPPKRRKKRATR